MAENKVKTYDKRTVDRYMEKGMIKRADYEGFLKALPDDSANADWVETDLEDEEMDMSDDLEDETSNEDSDTQDDSNGTTEEA